MRNNIDFNNDIPKSIGVKMISLSRCEKNKAFKRNEYQKRYHKSDNQVIRRKATKQGRAHLIGKDEKKNDHHKTEKMKPIEKMTTTKKT